MIYAEQRLAEIYSYYVDECYSDDYARTFVDWLAQSMYGDELTSLCKALFADAVRATQDEASTKG